MRLSLTMDRTHVYQLCNRHMFDIKYKSYQIIDRTERGHVSHVTLETVQNIAFFHGVTSPMERARNVIGAKRNLAKTDVSDKD